jgi:hypothetical protein
MPSVLPTHHFTKRDNMGYAIPPTVIVLLIMVGAGFLVCMAYAVHSAFGFGQDRNEPKPPTVEQMEYMAEVKIRNLEAMQREGRVYMGHGKRREEGEVIYD